MKQTHLQLFSEQSDKFLYSDSEPDSKPNHVSEPQNKIVSQLNNSVCRGFPQMQSREAFLVYALKKVASWRRFCVFVIRMDDPETEEKELTTKTFVDIGEIIERMCMEKNGFWGLPEAGLLGCFFPDMDESCGLETANDIQEQVKALGSITVSVGVAVWPFFVFEKKQILTNAKKALNHAAFFGPSSAVCFDAVSLNINGDKLYQEGDIDGAIEEFETALLIAPDNANVQNSLGVCYGEKKEFEKALAFFETLMQLDPKDIMAVYNAGMVSLKMGKKEQALEFFLEAGTIDANHFEVAFQTGKLLLEQKEYENARTYLEKAAELSLKSSSVQRFLGRCYTKLNVMENAIWAYSKAIKLNPYDAESLSALGYLYLEKGENQEIAALFCRQSVSLSPSTALFRYRLGKVYMKCCRFEDALTEFKKAAALGYDTRKYVEEIENQLTAEP
jgi:Flp pilus assembly protein TadD